MDCRLPETAKAWAYLNALALNHTEELTVLGSVANEYVTAKLQRAAVLHEKSLKRPWDRDRPRPWDKDGAGMKSFAKANSAMNTDNADEEPAWAGSSEDIDAEEDEESRIFEAYMTAKHQYRDILRSRGLDQEGIKKATEDRIALAKSKSFCSVCKQKGHWHRDAECPARKGAAGGTDSSKPGSKIQTAHAIFETNTNLGESLLAITDCACTKSVMGTNWLQRYVDVLRAMEVEVPLLPEQDNFRFGTSRIFVSSYAVVVPFRLGSSWVLLRASVVHGDLPLLVSRSALAALGMVYDLDSHVADFSAVQVTGHPLLTTPSGHPALNVHPGNQGLPPHVHPKMWDAKKSIRGDIQIVAHQEAYMVGTAGLDVGDKPLDLGPRVPQLFYEKKVTPEVRNMLSGDSLDLESFVRWWQLTKISADFWIETPEALIRVHVVPRRSFFNPSDWKTQQSLLRDNLFRVLGSVRSTYSVSCRSLRDLPVVSDMWEQGLGLPKPCHQCLWVGRTVFNRRELFAPSTSQPILVGNVPATGMADDAGRTSFRSTTSGPGTTSRLDGSGAAQRHYGSDGRDQDHPLPKGLSSEGRGDEGGFAHPRESNERGLDAEHQGLPRHAKRDGDDDRQTQGQYLRASPEKLRPLGGRGGESEWSEHAPRLAPLRDVVPTPGQPGLPRASDDPGQDEQPEKYAVVSLPERSMKSDTDQSWDEVRSMVAASKKGYDQEQLPLRPQPSSSSSSSKPTKRPAAKDKGTARMGVEPDPKVLDEIRALETRLATLKQRMGPEDEGDEL